MILLKESDPSFCMIDDIPCWNPKFHQNMLQTLSPIGWTSYISSDDGCCNIIKPSKQDSQLWIKETSYQWKILRIRSQVHHCINNQLWFEPYYIVYFGEIVIVKIYLKMFSHRTEYRLEWNPNWETDLKKVQLIFQIRLPVELCTRIQEMLTG